MSDSFVQLQDRWATPLGVHRWSAAVHAQDTLVRVLQLLRVQDPAASPGAAFYASSDDLLQRIRLPEWTDLIRFLVDGVSRTVAHANRGAWGAEHPAFQVAIRGLWCQMANRGAHHDVHTHGNCSWSGVYCLQVDPPAQREAHPVYGPRNGVTRFYGPYTHALSGAHNDFGNGYLQDGVWDVPPEPGQLVVFPSWLAHQALPYEGTRDRIILSFNVSIHAPSGSDQRHAYASA
jgi:uncharacterized protein (TIGR02466 family)